MSLTRPLPEYAVRHLFSRFGEVQAVVLEETDSRYGRVKFTSARAAQDALGLDGSTILGEALRVDQNCFYLWQNLRYQNFQLQLDFDNIFISIQ